MSAAAPDLIAGYLAELSAGLRGPAAETALIAAEAEDHLRESAAAAMASGMTELAAQQAAISGFGPVRAVVRAHRRRAVTAGRAAMALWKLAALLATTCGAAGLAGMGIFTYVLRSVPGGPRPVPAPLVLYAATAAGGLVLLATRRLTGRGLPGRDLLSPGVTASCFLVASALLEIFGFLLRSAPAGPPGPTGLCSFGCHFSGGSGPVPDPAPGAGPVLLVLVVYAVMAAAGLVLLAAGRLTGRRLAGCRLAGRRLAGRRLAGRRLAGRRLAGRRLTGRRLTGRGTPRRNGLSPAATASCFLLASAPLVALVVRLIASGRGIPIAPALTVSWATPLSAGSVSAAPLVAGALVAGCLAVAAGYGLVATHRRVRRRPGSGALDRGLGQADRGGAGRAHG